MQKELEIPSGFVTMKTNRDYRLSSLNGWVVNFKANEPTKVHPLAYHEALAVGAVVCEDEPEPVMVDRLKETRKDLDKSVAEAAMLEHQAHLAAVEAAIVDMFDHDRPDEMFKADGYPKLAEVTSRMPPNIRKPSAGELKDIYDDMKSNVEYADLFGD